MERVSRHQITQGIEKRIHKIKE